MESKSVLKLTGTSLLSCEPWNVPRENDKNDTKRPTGFGQHAEEVYAGQVIGLHNKVGHGCGEITRSWNDWTESAEDTLQ